MVTSFSVRTDTSNILRKEYQDKLDSMSVQELIKEFFSYLSYTEETDSGRIFHPISIGSCRVLMSEPLQMCLDKLKRAADGQ